MPAGWMPRAAQRSVVPVELQGLVVRAVRAVLVVREVLLVPVDLQVREAREVEVRAVLAARDREVAAVQVVARVVVPAEVRVAAVVDRPVARVGQASRTRAPLVA